MILIDEILVSNALLDEYFVCAIDKCKGACCWEGDYGAPLEKEELEGIPKILDQVTPYLSQESLEKIKQKGWHDKFGKKQIEGTQLLENGACVFLVKENGVAQCSFELADKEKQTGFRKPISCHLYPVRVEKNDKTGFQALNYDMWEICSAACAKGKALSVPLYVFVKDALIRKYGRIFYQRLEQIANRKSS